MEKTWAIPKQVGPMVMTICILAVAALAPICVTVSAEDGLAIPQIMTQWRQVPDVDKTYAEESQLPSDLWGSWRVLAESTDGGETVTSYRQPKPMIEVTQAGWRPNGQAAVAVAKPFFTILCDRTDPTVAVWFVACEKSANPLLVYVPRAGQTALVRELKLSATKGGNEKLSEVKRLLVAMPGRLASPAGTSSVREQAAGGGSVKQSSAPRQPDAIDRALADPDAVVGRWRWFVNGEEVPGPEFQPGGRVKDRADGSWMLQDPRERRYQFMWGNEFLDVMTLSADGMVLRGKNNHGDQIEGRRIEADVAAKAEVKRKEQAAPARIYVLSDGVRMTDAEIKAHNQLTIRKMSAHLVGLDPVDRARFIQGQQAMNPMIHMVSSGDKAGLRRFMTDLSNQPELAREIKGTLLYSPARDAIIALDDGRALYWREMWEEAAASLIEGP